ncbi:MAG: beta-propeller fold lactonase family protein [Acidobacteria bacterium]|nr:beta-propeller fold lactonase family protein [Acidobacteriota bacterium]
MNRLLLFCLAPTLSAPAPHPLPDGGYALPNGWKITPFGKSIPTEDLILNLQPSPDGKVVIAQHGGFNPHGLVVMDAATEEAVQRIPLPNAWLGLAWSSDGRKLYVSGGNSNHQRNPSGLAPIYVFDYRDGRLSEKPAALWTDSLPKSQVYWTGLAQHPKKPLLYAGNRGNDPLAGNVTVFDTDSGRVLTRITVQASPYDLVLSPAGDLLYVSNWSSRSISVIDTATNKVVGSIAVGINPNDMELAADGRLYVSNGNENTITVVDVKQRRAIETVSVALTPRAPEGTTPNGLALDRANNMLFVANADNNCVAVVNVAKPGQSHVLGFIPSGWYPSALYLSPKQRLYIGNSKGLAPHANPEGPNSPLAKGKARNQSVKHIQKGSVGIISVAGLRGQIKKWTRQVYDNVPYNDDLLLRAKPPKTPTIVPSDIASGSPIKHVIYVIKENRTYDQVLGDMKQGNGDARLAIFGENVTPNHHALASQWVLLDNLYCDGEVSVDGHSWSNSAYATDYNEKMWPASYGGHSQGTKAAAYVPSAGYMWDLAARKGLTYRTYGEYAVRASDGSTMEAAPGVGALVGHVAPRFKLAGARDTDNVREFIREFDEYEKNFDSQDPNKRLPNYIVMSLPEDHTAGTRPGGYTPRAMVANADHAVGMLVERVTKSKYWPETAIFMIEDDAQDGADHVDARRTVGLVISPYTRRGVVDSTLYTTSSMLRTIQLLLGLPPMTQYDAAAPPMYAAFQTTPEPGGYTAIAPSYNVDERNTALAWGAKESMEMDLDEVDRAPMFALNRIIWKSVRGADSEMPAPVHRFWFQKR